MLVKLCDSEIRVVNGGHRGLFIAGTLVNLFGALISAAHGTYQGDLEEAGKPDALFSSKKAAKHVDRILDLAAASCGIIGTGLMAFDKGIGYKNKISADKKNI